MPREACFARGDLVEKPPLFGELHLCNLLAWEGSMPGSAGILPASFRFCLWNMFGLTGAVALPVKHYIRGVTVRCGLFHLLKLAGRMPALPATRPGTHSSPADSPAGRPKSLRAECGRFRGRNRTGTLRGLGWHFVPPTGW